MSQNLESHKNLSISNNNINQNSNRKPFYTKKKTILGSQIEMFGYFIQKDARPAKLYDNKSK